MKFQQHNNMHDQTYWNFNNTLGPNVLKFQEYIRTRHNEISICQEFQQCELIETSTTQYDKTYWNFNNTLGPNLLKFQQYVEDEKIKFQQYIRTKLIEISIC